MTIAEFDHLDIDKKKELMQKCCGSSVWIHKMLQIFPVNDLLDLLEYADEKWYECKPEDWLEAFKHYSMAEDVQSIKESFSATEWDSISEENKTYHEKFGFDFIIYTLDKSPKEIHSLLQQRLLNNPDDEIKITAAEQNRITKSRLEKLFV